MFRTTRFTENIRFKNATVNIGQALNVEHGVFTAPVGRDVGRDAESRYPLPGEDVSDGGHLHVSNVFSHGPLAILKQSK